jgi:hypothetical protein
MARQREKLACTGPRPLLIGYTATKAPGECPGLADWIKRWRQRRARQGLIHAFFFLQLAAPRDFDPTHVSNGSTDRRHSMSATMAAFH